MPWNLLYATEYRYYVIRIGSAYGCGWLNNSGSHLPPVAAAACSKPQSLWDGSKWCQFTCLPCLFVYLVVFAVDKRNKTAVNVMPTQRITEFGEDTFLCRKLYFVFISISSISVLYFSVTNIVSWLQ